MKYPFFLLLFFSYTVSAQTLNSTYPNQPYSNLYLIDVMDNYIYTIGSCNTMMISPDEGLTWSIMESPIGNGIIDLDIIPNTNGKKAIILKQGLIIVYDSQTDTYITISDDNLRLSAGKYKSIIIKGNYVYVISNNSIHKSEIGVYTWSKSTKLNLGNDYTYSSDFTENYIWIGTNSGKILKISFTDGIATTTTDLGGRIRNLDMVNDELGYAISSAKYNIQKTVDGANTFSILTGMPEAISPVGWGDNTIMSINTNRIYTSDDGGQTSKRYPLPDDGYTNLVSAYKMTDEGELYFVGKASMVIKTNDFAETFIHLNKIKRENLQSICINSTGEGYAIGGYSTFVHTSDNGKSWTPIELNLSPTKSFINDIEPIGQNRFMLGHQNGTSIIEEGTVVQTDSIPCQLIMKSKIYNYIIASRRIGNEYMISKSNDNGSSWTDLFNAPIYVSDIKESNTGKIFITGENNTLIISEDQGLNWKIQEVSGLDRQISSMDFIDDNFGILSTGQAIYLTRDGGKTASALKTGYGLQNLKIIDNEHFIATSISNQKTSIFETVDQGNEWELTNTFCSKTYNIFYDNKNTVWLANEGGHINKHTILNPSKISELSNYNPIIAYPNPVKSGRDIFLTLKGNHLTSLQIIELATGKIIYKQSKIKSGKVSIKKLIPGLYILKTINSEDIYYNKLVVE